MSKMDNQIISEIHTLLQGGLEASERVDLSSLLWTIDAKHRIVPEVSELNEALALLSRYQILRDSDGVGILRSELVSSEQIEKNDIKTALNKYESIINDNS